MSLFAVYHFYIFLYACFCFPRFVVVYVFLFRLAEVDRAFQEEDKKWTQRE